MVGLRDFVRYRIEDYNLMRKYYKDSSVFTKIKYCWLKLKYQRKYNFAHLEFFCLHLGEKTEAEVAKFYPRKLQAELYGKVNDKNMWAITKDKFASYQVLKEFYNRKVCGYNPSPNPIVKKYYDGYDWKTDILDFLRIHSRFIIKPLAESCGMGVRIIESDISDDKQLLLESLIASYPQGFVIEELIQQHEFMAIMHPASVNTMRVNVFNSTSYWDKSGGDIEIQFPCFRVGRHGAIVDNAGSGGIIVAIDAESGRMISSADEEGDFYQEHPESHLPFNCEIPYWKELIATATKVSRACPSLKVAGLDFALDKEKGWSLVEINVEPYMIYQIATQKGIRDYMESFARKCCIQ